MPTQPTAARRSHHTTAVCVLIGLLLLVVPAAATAQSSVESYDVGEATILQKDLTDTRFYEMPVALQGVLAVPDGEGPFPVALLVHGVYEFCTTIDPQDEEVDVYPCPPEGDLRQYEGFSYLAEALASRGYIAIAPDLSAEFNTGYGFPEPGERVNQIIEAHLEALAAGDGFEGDVAGKADLSRLVVATHSRGGPIALGYLSDDATNRSASALAMLTPAYAPKPKIPATMPTALVIAQCDGDVGTKTPLQYRNEQLKPLRKALTVFYTIKGGTHSAFSTKLGSDPSSPCEEEKLLAPAVQQDWASHFLPDFFDMALASGRLPVTD